MAVVNGTANSDFIHMAGDGYTGGGNEISTVTNAADDISGLAGNDLIHAAGGADTVSGGDGSDTLIGGQGTDRLFGGTGNDVIRFAGVSEISGLAEIVNGGNDFDAMDFQTYNAFGAVDLTLATIVDVERLAIQGNDVTLTSAQLGAFVSLIGTGLIERFLLSDGGLVDLSGAEILGIEQFIGNDLVNTLDLSLVAVGQAAVLRGGNDQATGGAGSDSFDGGDGSDSLRGEAGNDTLTGGEGADTLIGGSGNDLILGGPGSDSMIGGAGNDTFRMTLVSDLSGLPEVIDGGADTDTLDLATGAGSVDLSQVTISDVENLLILGTEVTIRAGQLNGFSLVQGTGLIERIILAQAGNVNLSGDQVLAIEEFRGSSGDDGFNFTNVATGQSVNGVNGADTVTGGAAADVIDGGNGADRLSGEAGADTLRGGQGADALFGGIGNDQIQVAGVSDLSGLAETVDGGNDQDALDFQVLGATGRVDLSTVTITGVEILRLISNTVVMTAAQMGSFESILGSGFLERLVLAAAGVVDLSNTEISGIDEFLGTSGADTFLFAAATGVVRVNGQGGADSILGGNSDDVLTGGGGGDTLSGGAGVDTLNGGLGTDLLTGGLNGDVFQFTDASEMGTGAARDVIADFVHGTDLIDLSGIDANVTVFGNQGFTFIGAAAFSGVAGQLRYAGGVLSGDLDGNGSADIQIGLTGSPVITGADLVL